MLHLELRRSQSQIRNVGKSPGSGKGQKVKGAANKGSTTKSTINQPNGMEALVTSMASNMVIQVKPIIHVPSDFSAQGVDPRLCCEARFSRH